MCERREARKINVMLTAKTRSKVTYNTTWNAKWIVRVFLRCKFKVLRRPAENCKLTYSCYIPSRWARILSHLHFPLRELSAIWEVAFSPVYGLSICFSRFDKSSRQLIRVTNVIYSLLQYIGLHPHCFLWKNNLTGKTITCNILNFNYYY